jgi:peptidoglycan/xylan/chitin deacetylase (PgdA/CDA1 family)
MSRALILMYHLVDIPRSGQEQRFCTTPNDFAHQMEYLAESGYTALSMAQLCDCLEGKVPMPGKTVHITFDDGFSCVLDYAVPILQRHGFPATMFAVSDRLGSSNDWMTGRGFPERTILSADGLRALENAGFTIGSHTQTHARLTDISADEAKEEIRSSKCRLEDAQGKSVDYFAYPFGRLNEMVRDLVAGAGYRAACSTRAGFNRPGEDPYLLRRIDVFGTDRLWQFRQKLRFGINEASHTYPLRYMGRRVMARLGA